VGGLVELHVGAKASGRLKAAGRARIFHSVETCRWWLITDKVLYRLDLYLLYLLVYLKHSGIALPKNSSYLSILHPHGTTRLPLDGLSLNLIFEHLSKICGENSVLIKIW